MTAQSGIVYLVGAGPGDRTYLTLQAYSLLSRAEVLVHDALVDERVLEVVPPSCHRVDVGKRGGQTSTPQDEINHMLVDYCQHGKRVIRLKGGDPFIFGRCATEIDALRQSGCQFEVIPGLSSAFTAPLLAGIPLTDPVLSRCIAVFSAHDLEGINWDALTQLETLVILMGTRHLPDIVEQLQQHGQSSKTPIAVIRRAGQSDQQVWAGTLETILQQTARQVLSPAVIVVGEVVGLRPYLQPALPGSDRLNRESKSHPFSTEVGVDSHPQPSSPLRGKTVLVTRSASQSSDFGDRLRDYGATVIDMPALEIGPPSSWADLDQAIAHLETFDWLILTSGNGVNAFFERLLHQGKDARDLSGIKVAVVGKKTAATLRQRGIQPDFIPPDFVADSLIAHFPDQTSLQTLKILFPRVESGGRDALVKDFTEEGAMVTEVAAYESRCPDTIPPEAFKALQSGAIDIITFASSKTVKYFHQLCESHSIQCSAFLTSKEQFEPVCLASIGPQTSAACQKWLGKVDVEAKEYTLDGLIQAIVRWSDVSTH
ncbi:MAG: uroporphyrinogen-III C-methyltransferase [Elainellaceae cyanobacterium]